MKKLLLIFLLAAFPCFGQYTIPQHTGATASSGTPSLFPGSQWLQDEDLASCSSGSTSCTAGTGSCATTLFCMFPLTSGSTGIVYVGFNSGTAGHITSAYLCNVSTGCNSGNATATFSLCPSSNCNAVNSTLGYGADMAYEIGSPANSTQYITVNVSSTGGAGWNFQLYEHITPPGYTETYSSSGVVNGGSANTCATCTGGTPTSASTPQNVFEFNDFDGNLPITGYGYSSPWIFDVSSNAVCLDCSNPSAPSYTNTSGTGTIFSWIAFALSANYTVQNPISIANHVAPGTACTSSPCTLTVPSTGSGNLLRIFALATTQGSASYISSVSDGTNSFVVPSGSRSSNATGNQQSSDAYLLSSTSGKTSLTIAMTQPIQTGVYLSYWEIKKPSGSWTLDSGSPQCTLNSTGTYLPSGQALTLNNTSTPHVIFQSITSEGGVGGVTLFPWQYNVFGSEAYIGGVGGNFGSDVALLNTKNGSAPTWSTAEENTITTGVCAEAFY